MALKSKTRPFRRLVSLATALVLAALLAVPSSGIAQAQEPFGGGIVLVNAGRDFVERKGGGEFVARPVFDRQIETLFESRVILKYFERHLNQCELACRYIVHNTIRATVTRWEDFNALCDCCNHCRCPAIMSA